MESIRRNLSLDSIAETMRKAEEYVDIVGKYKDQVKEKIKEGVSVVSERGSEVLRNILSSEIQPTKVIEVNADVFISRDIVYREEGLVLYAPLANNKKDKSRFEIALNKPYTESLNQSYSLFRSEDKEEAENKFICLKDKVPIFITVAKEMVNVHGLQKLCDTLTEHPEWTVAHLAAHFGLTDAFQHDIVNSQLNSSDGLTGMSPLQVAISTNNISIVKVLINSNCSLEHLDYKGNSVYHYAASTNKEIISALTQGSTGIQRCLNAKNHNGHTPLHIACLADKPECVKALMLGGADVNISATMQESLDPYIPSSYVGNFLQDNPKALSIHDMKFGGTPLHWSSSRQVIEALVDVDCNINARNFENRTALHMMVMRNRLDCVVALLSRQADPDLGDLDGNRPIHLAIIEGNIPIIQTLIIFGANLDVLNNKGETARHLMKREQEPKLLYYLHAVGAIRCPSDMLECTDGCRADGTYNGIPPTAVLGPVNRDILNQMLGVAGMDEAARKKTHQRGRLLCLDGGGIRGLVLIQMLLEMERVVNQPMNNCFDWIAGTSTGGILALGLATGKTMKECLCLYFRMKEVTFVGFRPYPSEALETVLKETFGTDTVMASIKQPKVMVTGVLADRKPADFHLFRNYQSPSDVLDVKHDYVFENPAPPEQQLIWEVGRATGAAPTYFRAFGRFLDGGLIANNPTLDSLTEIHEYNLALSAVGRHSEITKLTAVVSLGTGLIPVTPTKVDVFRPESLWDNAKLVFGISQLGCLLVDQATASDGRVVDRARAWCSSIGVPYYRFSPQMSEDVAMDEKSDEKLVKMLWETKAYMHDNLQTLREVATLLND